MIGNPFNPAPGPRMPGLAGNPSAPFITTFNRGAFDAAGLPYAFVSEDLGEVLIRNLVSNGTSGFSLYFFVVQMTEMLGAEGTRQALRYINDQFVVSRNEVFNVDPFWQPSPQVHPAWIGQHWILRANVNKPEGFVEPPHPGDGPNYYTGDDLKRWSLYPRTAPSYDLDGNPLPYDLYQSEFDAGVGDTDTLPVTAYRAGVFPFPALQLRGMSEDVYGDLVTLQPVFL